jgi:hypothetical protein
MGKEIGIKQHSANQCPLMVTCFSSVHNEVLNYSMPNFLHRGMLIIQLLVPQSSKLKISIPNNYRYFVGNS